MTSATSASLGPLREPERPVEHQDQPRPSLMGRIGTRIRSLFSHSPNPMAPRRGSTSPHNAISPQDPEDLVTQSPGDAQPSLSTQPSTRRHVICRVPSTDHLRRDNESPLYAAWHNNPLLCDAVTALETKDTGVNAEAVNHALWPQVRDNPQLRPLLHDSATTNTDGQDSLYPEAASLQLSSNGSPEPSFPFRAVPEEETEEPLESFTPQHILQLYGTGVGSKILSQTPGLRGLEQDSERGLYPPSDATTQPPLIIGVTGHLPERETPDPLYSCWGSSSTDFKACNPRLLQEFGFDFHLNDWPTQEKAEYPEANSEALNNNGEHLPVETSHQFARQNNPEDPVYDNVDSGHGSTTPPTPSNASHPGEELRLFDEP